MEAAIKRLNSVHFVGIKGVAMTALAIYCKEKGMRVTGSDVEEEFPTKESLEKVGIVPLRGFSEEHISQTHKPDLVIFTGAHGGKDNKEVLEAVRLGIQTIPHGRALGFFMEESVQISVAGSHGKTTTTAMIATILSSSAKDPSYAVGCGDIRPIGLPGHFGKGKEFVAEADEYITDPTHDRTPRFLWQHPDILVVTNIDFDHPDAYESLEEVQNAFRTLQKQQKGVAVTIINGDDPKSEILQNGKTVYCYGCTENNDFSVFDIHFQEGKTTFQVRWKKKSVGEFTLHVPGTCNISNALAAIAACHTLGVSWDEIRAGLASFNGTKRRFELVGTVGASKIYDDYAHHPHEIRASLEGIRAWYPNARIITIFQPHTFSRTKALFQEFATCFAQSDFVLIPDIYASARETVQHDVTSQMLVAEISKHKNNAYFIHDYTGALECIKKITTTGDIIVCMGAGDIYEWSKKFIEDL
jgi:UDP-N-acetylmuramate--alanine ligase